MVNSSEVPSCYTAQWDAGIRRSSTSTSATSEGSNGVRPKYNSSCTRCRKSRVKCSGGNPCSRCARSASPSLCVYVLSQRRGKLRAANPAPHSACDDTSRPCPDGFYTGTDDQQELGNFLQFSPENPWSPMTPSVESDAFAQQLAFADSTDISPNIFDVLDSLPLRVSPQPAISTASIQNFPCDCAATSQSCLGRLSQAEKNSESNSLDQVLKIFQDSATHVSTYLACGRCDDGCALLMNLSVLYQRQVNLLCVVAKNPASYLEGARGLRFSLGDYQATEEEDLTYKRLAIRAAASKVDSLVTSWENVLDSYDESKLSEAGRMNVEYMNNVAKHLRSRLKVILSILDKEDWASA